jgi:hypothetical protein
MIRNGADNATDRATGAYWEAEFCRMARDHGKVFTPHQFKHDGPAMFYGESNWTLPDITIWSAPGEHHEIKHKRPTAANEFGLERYRLNALIKFANTTGQKVLYTIHDWEAAGASGSQDRVGNNLAHWYAGDIAELCRGATDKRWSPTYYNGELHELETWYWTAHRYFKPLTAHWQILTHATDNGLMPCGWCHVPGCTACLGVT